MKPIAVVAALLISAGALADGLEIQGQRLVVKVGHEADLPKDGVTSVAVEDTALAKVSESGPQAKVMTVKALKPGTTRIVVTKASGTRVSYDLHVKL